MRPPSTDGSGGGYDFTPRTYDTSASCAYTGAFHASLSDSSALLLLFVVLPLVLAPIVIVYVDRRSPKVVEGARTSELLQDGEPVQAELVGWRILTTFFFDPRPMIEFTVRFADGAELVTTQAVPRLLVGDLRTGMELVVSVNAERTAGAVVLEVDDGTDDGTDEGQASSTIP